MSQHDPYAQKYIDDYYAVDERERLLAQAEKKVKEARTALYVVGGITLLGGILYMFIDKVSGIDTLIISSIIALIFFVLAHYTQKNAKRTVLIGLILYCAFWLVDIIADPESLVKGLLVKVIIIAVLAKGYRAAREVQELKAELGKIDFNKAEDKPLDQV